MTTAVQTRVAIRVSYVIIGALACGSASSGTEMDIRREIKDAWREHEHNLEDFDVRWTEAVSVPKAVKEILLKDDFNKHRKVIPVPDEYETEMHLVSKARRILVEESRLGASQIVFFDGNESHALKTQENKVKVAVDNRGNDLSHWALLFPVYYTCLPTRDDLTGMSIDNCNIEAGPTRVAFEQQVGTSIRRLVVDRSVNWLPVEHTRRDAKTGAASLEIKLLYDRESGGRYTPAGWSLFQYLPGGVATVAAEVTSFETDPKVDLDDYNLQYPDEAVRLTPIARSPSSKTKTWRVALNLLLVCALIIAILVKKTVSKKSQRFGK